MVANVSIVIPSYGRPEQLSKCIEQIKKVSPDVEVIVYADGNDRATYKAAKAAGAVSKLSKTRQGPVSLWNKGAALATGDFLVLGADDLWFTDGWLDAAMRAIAKLGYHGVVAFNDLSPMAGHQAVHYLVSRSVVVYEWGGVLAMPAYKHYFFDGEVTARAHLSKHYVYAEDCVVEHRHHLWQKSGEDDTYKYAQPHYAEEEEIFEKRKKAGFPNDWKPVVQMNNAGRGTNDWGSVAITYRTYKYPEPFFVNSWTNLLLKGLENGDNVISGPLGLPGHVAANALARRFLGTKADSILFIDDDMTFEPNALSLIRHDPRTKDYDIIFGFCTHRTNPPHAVVMHRLEEQPGLPVSLEGERYGMLRDIADDQIIDVDAVGLAFTLIKRHVFEAMLSKYGVSWTYFFGWGPGNEGEDVTFSRRCRELGFRLGVTTRVKVGHIGTNIMGWDQFQNYADAIRNRENGKV